MPPLSPNSGRTLLSPRPSASSTEELSHTRTRPHTHTQFMLGKYVSSPLPHSNTTFQLYTHTLTAPLNNNNNSYYTHTHTYSLCPVFFFFYHFVFFLLFQISTTHVIFYIWLTLCIFDLLAFAFIKLNLTLHYKYLLCTYLRV